MYATCVTRLLRALPITLTTITLPQFMSHPHDSIFPISPRAIYFKAANLSVQCFARNRTQDSYRSMRRWFFQRCERGAQRRAINHLLGERIKIDKRAIYTSETKRAYQQKHQALYLSSIPYLHVTRICKENERALSRRRQFIYLRTLLICSAPMLSAPRWSWQKKSK